MEFSVNMTCGSCEEAVQKSLEKIEGIKKVSIDVAKQQVIVEGSTSSAVIQKAIEETGMLAVLRGQGYGKKQNAVSILKNENNQTFGIVRFVQLTEKRCLIDSSLNGLNPVGNYTLLLHEYGDISEGAESTGDIYHPSLYNDCDQVTLKAGDLGKLSVDKNGSSIRKFEKELIRVDDIIGRAMVLHEDMKTDEKCDFGKGIAFGIVARSAGMFENDKKICTCSGKTIWEERIESRKEINQ